MAQTGYTPISIYYSSTATNVPTAGNLVAGELAINTADGKLFYKDSAGAVQVIGTKGGVGTSSTTQVLYNSSGLVAGSSNFVFDGTNVGIGTSSPAAKLDVGVSNGFLRSGTSGSDTNYNIRANSGSNCSITWTENGQADRWTVGCYTGNGALAFRQNSSNMGNGTEYMRIDSSGNLMVGTTTANGKVAINAASGQAPLYLRVFTNGDAGTFYANASGTIVGSVTVNSGSVLYNVTSDYRLKSAIASVVDAGQRIDAIEPIEYDFQGGGRIRGFLAHKFAEVYPNSVSGEKDAVDAEGKPVYQAMQASTPEVMADLIAEIQSLRKRVATLEAK